MLQTLLSEVLTKDEWLRAWDNIFSNHPSFLLFVVVAYVIVSRKALLQCTRKEDFEVRISSLFDGFESFRLEKLHILRNNAKYFSIKNCEEPNAVCTN